MVKQSDLVTKKDLGLFGKKLEEKLDEKFDVKFAEYFEIIIKAVVKEVNNAFDRKFEETGIHFQKDQERQDFELTTQESSLTTVKYKLDNHEQRITHLEKRPVASLG